MSDELETILRLVAEGKLSPEEADPIIDALTRAQRAEADALEAADDAIGRGLASAHRSWKGMDRRIDRAFARAEQRLGDLGVTGRGRRLRIRVTERGRQVVNLQIPIGLVEGALQFVPGLGGDQRERVRDAVRAGVIGPIVDVEDEDGGGVLISVE